MPARLSAFVRRACWLVLPAMVAAGCGSDNTTAQSPTTPNDETAAVRQTASAGPSLPSMPAGNTPSRAPTVNRVAAGPTMPKGAKYTIFCTAFAGPGHIETADVSRENLIRSTGRREFYVVHEEEASTIYFGYYREFQKSVDAREGERAEKDLAFVKSLADATGAQVFHQGMFQPLPAPDPEGPPEYDLARLDRDKDPDDPDRRYWSIAIAVYTADATPDPRSPDAGKNRKQLAVESVTAARKMGVEAYYYNGPNNSLVCIGAWPRRAVHQQTVDQQQAHNNGDDIVAINVPMPDSLREEIENSGKHVNIVEPKIKIEDPTLVETWRQYRYYEINGKPEMDVTTDPNTGLRREKPKTSFLVEIPLAQPQSLLSTADRTPDAPQAQQAPEANPMTPGVSSGVNRLRSVQP